MRKIPLGIALLAMFVFSVFAVASASASQWLYNSNTIPTGSNLAVDTEGETILIKLVLGLEAVVVKCDGLLEGTITGPTTGLVTDAYDLEHPTTPVDELTGTNSADCEVTRTVSGECSAVGTLADVWVDFLNLGTALTWPTAISLSGEKFILTVGNATEKAGYEVQCLNETGGVIKEELCEGESQFELTNVAAGVLAVGLGTPASSCPGGVGTADIKGEGTITHAEGTLSVSE